MANEIFIDTSGFFALLVQQDDQHQAAQQVMQQARRRKRTFVTSDYVLDETATLIKARGYTPLLKPLFHLIDATKALRIEWMDADRFSEVSLFFLKHSDQEWSFTDCASFCIMKKLRLRDALTKDAHFQHAGFMALLAK